jgi:hypothetical protein
LSPKFSEIVYFFSKGGRQNIANEIVDEAKRLFGNQHDKICAWLKLLYKAETDTQMRQKIKLAETFFGCRKNNVK